MKWSNPLPIGVYCLYPAWIDTQQRLKQYRTADTVLYPKQDSRVKVLDEFVQKSRQVWSRDFGSPSGSLFSWDHLGFRSYVSVIQFYWRKDARFQRFQESWLQNRLSLKLVRLETRLALRVSRGLNVVTVQSASVYIGLDFWGSYSNNYCLGAWRIVHVNASACSSCALSTVHGQLVSIPYQLWRLRCVPPENSQFCNSIFSQSYLMSDPSSRGRPSVRLGFCSQTNL